MIWSVVCQDVETSGVRRALRSHLQEEEKQAAEADSTGYYQAAPIQVFCWPDTPYFLIAD